MSDLIRIRALVRLDVDQAIIEPGATADVRAELVESLLALGAIELVPEPAAKPGKGKAG